MKANDFLTGVANKKRRLCSSRRLLWSSRMGWQVVSTTIFEWLLNLWSKMWINYRILAADNLPTGSIEAPSVTCFGLITCRVKGWQLETGCPLRRLFLSYFNWKAKVISIKSWSNEQLKNWKTNQVNPCAHVVKNLVSKRDPKFSSLKIWFSSTVQWLSDFQEIQENLLQRLSDFFNGFPLSSILSKYSYLEYFDFPLRAS